MYLLDRLHTGSTSWPECRSRQRSTDWGCTDLEIQHDSWYTAFLRSTKYRANYKSIWWITFVCVDFPIENKYKLILWLYHNTRFSWIALILLLSFHYLSMTYLTYWRAECSIAGGTRGTFATLSFTAIILAPHSLDNIHFWLSFQPFGRIKKVLTVSLRGHKNQI